MQQVETKPARVLRPVPGGERQSGLPDSTVPRFRSGESSGWGADPELKAVDAMQPVEWAVLTLSAAIMIGLFMWQSGSLTPVLDGVALFVRTAVRELKNL